ncbi:polyribonucleotide nucleotidyltransferase [Sporobacter termitidis DSM 10068]|uniref:Polyribonucleotide nucleotidyltransferase n=1 Tax=Sporobacter termitidis DSM 10068 TaxID=1123282 RepID=A0A1M5Y446_9FIRM|nr:polyribonucleotide nucleotidyltransferase [Sporobacter termitidis]SHI06782.1 polyribonucleotide nucleotidyltransferase [Sporobacter termitidis DSM 10068]
MIIKHREFPGYKQYSTTLGGRPLTLEVGKLAELANAAVLVKYGETTVLVTATASSRPRDGIDYFPLGVDFEEKIYSVGRIPGGYLRREGRPSERGILASRMIDRPMRPLFPHDLRNDVIISCTVMSVDYDNAPEIAAMIGASAAVSISDIPFNGPIAGVGLGYHDGKYLINPTSAERKVSDMYCTIAATEKKIVMIEAVGNQVPEDVMLNGIIAAHEAIKPVIALINQMVAEIGKPKFEYAKASFNEELFQKIVDKYLDDVRFCMDTDDKNIREERYNAVVAKMIEEFGEQYPEISAQLEEITYKIQKKVVKAWLLEGKRVDGRSMNEIRPLSAEVGVLPRVHGSGLFTRGQTQVLSIATLGTLSEAQNLDTIFEETSKRYMHHYNFPSFSTGEARPSRSASRREIGHGALAEKALEVVLPSIEEFPYAIRVVSEVLSSNGSTSQGSICGSTLALMDAGVPIKAPVAGISCGLISDGDSWTTFIDIQGVEDFHGEMDFKVAGTKTGITAIQMDLKNDGLTYDIIKNAFEITREARLQILDEVMLPVIAKPREELAPTAPKMISMKINPDKIREVIGSGGKVIQKIVADTGAKIDIEDDGSVFISSSDIEACRAAKKIIDSIVFVPEIGQLYYGKVVRIIPIGAFVELAPGKDGMVHISKLENRRVEKVEDVLKEGDMTWVKVTDIDDRGRVNLSRKDAIKERQADGLPIDQA